MFKKCPSDVIKNPYRKYQELYFTPVGCAEFKVIRNSAYSHPNSRYMSPNSIYRLETYIGNSWDCIGIRLCLRRAFQAIE